MKFIASRLIGGLLITLLIGGCATSTQVGPFSQAASDATPTIKQGFDQIQETTVLRKMSDIASDTSGPTEDTFTGLLKTNELAPRLEFLDELKRYADSLGTLATTDYRKDLDSASKDLDGALYGLTTTYKNATGQELPYSEQGATAVATAVEAIGNAIVEHKREAALRRIIIETDPAIQRVAEDLERTFDGLAKDNYVYENLNSVVADMKSSYNLQTPKWGYDERLSYLTKIRQAVQARDSAKPFMEAAARSSAALAKAHHALFESAQSGKLTGAKIVQGIRELVDEANKAKAFYNEIAKNNS